MSLIRDSYSNHLLISNLSWLIRIFNIMRRIKMLFCLIIIIMFLIGLITKNDCLNNQEIINTRLLRMLNT